ncbi:MAG TPA: hypothetical protein VNJ04_17585 [Gemmatimonadaceae bacterium]|nr:hypothetical protein [Gemmatimonadaceae bacterium]
MFAAQNAALVGSRNTARSPPIRTWRTEMLGREAGYLVGVQVGLRLRGRDAKRVRIAIGAAGPPAR